MLNLSLIHPYMWYIWYDSYRCAEAVVDELEAKRRNSILGRHGVFAASTWGNLIW